MKELKGKTAFITGGASGIGLGIAKACGKAGMNVIIADMRQTAIDEALPYFKEKGWPVYGIRLDVTDREAYAAAADEAEAAFGKIHVLVNNAGVEVPSHPLWESTYNDCDFIIGVNIKGIINGIINIVPRILAHGEEGHVVSTSSQSGLSVVPGFTLYNMTKAAVAAMMETVASDLKGTNVGASAFFPGPVQGNLSKSSLEVRPESLKNADAPAKAAPPPPPPPPPAGDKAGPGNFFDFSNLFMSAEEAGERVIRGILRGDLYIMTHSEFRNGVKAKCDALVRSFPDQPVNETMMKLFSMLTYNPVYDTQTTPPALEK
ncbi:MAG: SDR family NAD(P)-dependent oxidoreductase [Oscillospiraceae bacterium]|jgi:NADP-dependent 3-hydroxy acid dehydrogenase YdfG|nr:SDR family NAD(P)-dependent oxidoreductase [Oscillospiraceae bacterium]